MIAADPAGLPAEDYPWTPVAMAGRLSEAGFEPGDLGRLDDRTAVIGVGSNRCPEVLAAKFGEAGIDLRVPMAPAVVRGLGIGHSAHVSRRGYLAAAPIHDPGTVSAVTVAWLDRHQLDALDRTEPNYQRIRLGPEVSLTGDRRTAGVEPSSVLWIYRSRWGLVAEGEAYLPLSPQPVVQQVLRRIPGLADLWSADTAPSEVVLMLSQPEVRDRVRAALSAAEAIRRSGFGSSSGVGANPACDPGRPPVSNSES